MSLSAGEDPPYWLSEALFTVSLQAGKGVIQGEVQQLDYCHFFYSLYPSTYRKINHTFLEFQPSQL